MKEACISGDLETIKRLGVTDKSLRTLMREACGKTIFGLCCEYNHKHCIDAFITEFKLSLSDELKMACYYRDTIIIKFLLENYTIPLDSISFPDISHVVYEEEMVKLLLDRGLRKRGLDECFNAWGNRYNVSACYLMEYGERLEQCSYQSAVPKWAWEYQAKLDVKRKNCNNSTIAFLFVLRCNRVPKCLARDVIRKWLRPTWLNEKWYF